MPANVDETPHAGEAPAAYVLRIAAAKVAAVWASATVSAADGGAHRSPAIDRWVLAADTAVVLDGIILGKAADGREAAAMLRHLSGRSHEVMTAFVIAGAASHGEVVTSDVQMVALDDATIADYVASGEWQGKAGAYAIQGMAAAFVSAVRGSVTNVIGLPLAEVLAALRQLGVPGASFSHGVPS